MLLWVCFLEMMEVLALVKVRTAAVGGQQGQVQSLASCASRTSLPRPSLGEACHPERPQGDLHILQLLLFSKQQNV